jgi:hypothetical protein
VAPSQLTGVVWCHLNSFEELFQDYREVFDNAPFRSLTMSLFLQLLSVHGFHFLDHHPEKKEKLILDHQQT